MPRRRRGPDRPPTYHPNLTPPPPTRRPHTCSSSPPTHPHPIFLCRPRSAKLPESARHRGALAQLVARFHGMEEVRGSNPLSSTSNTKAGRPPGQTGLLFVRRKGTHRHCELAPYECSPSGRSHSPAARLLRRRLAVPRSGRVPGCGSALTAGQAQLAFSRSFATWALLSWRRMSAQCRRWLAGRSEVRDWSFGRSARETVSRPMALADFDLPGPTRHEDHGSVRLLAEDDESLQGV